LNQWSSAVANAKKSRQSGRGPAGKQANSRQSASRQSGRGTASKQAAGKQAAGKQAARERVAGMRAQAKRAERRRNLLTISAIAAVVVIVGGGVAWYAASRGGSTSSIAQEIVPTTPTGAPQNQPTALVVPNTSGISGVVAYDTAGWPTASKNGPANQALGHTHVTGPVTYSVTPPVGGDHNPTPLTCGVYAVPVPNEYAVHDLEHGAIWITYQPSLPQSEVDQLKSFVDRQSVLTPSTGGPGSRYMTLTPYPGLPTPVVMSSWGFQLRLSSPTDPRMQQFVDKFRASQQFTPEYGGECTNGAGTPAST
jgi:hypothetical protein